jgi:hypothetical protein
MLVRPLQIRGLSYTTQSGSTSISLTAVDARKAAIFNGALYCTGPTNGIGGTPFLGVGVNLVGPVGELHSPVL